jgi:hypothetical protein
MVGVLLEPAPKVKEVDADGASPLPKLKDEGAEKVPSVENGFLIVLLSEPPAPKVNEVPPLAPKMDPSVCGAAGCGAAGAWDEPKLKMGADDAGVDAGGLANKPVGFVSVAPAVAPKIGFDAADPAVAPKRGFDSGTVLPNKGFVSWAGAEVVAPNRLLACVAGAAMPLKMPLVSVAGAADVLAPPNKFFVSADSGAGVDAAEPNRELVDLLSVLPNAGFFAAGSSMLVVAGAVLEPKRLFAGLLALAPKREAAGFSAGVSADWVLPNRPPN